MDYGFAPGVTRWENVMREMLRRRRNTNGVPLVGPESIEDFFRYLRRENFTADDLVLGSHATNEGILFLDLDAVTSDQPATYEVLEQVESSRTIEIPAGVRKSTTRVHIKGCRIGADECRPYLALLKKALDNPVQVTAPKFFHGLYVTGRHGTFDPGRDGIFEWMGHSYQVITRDPFKKHADLVAAFQKANLTRLDGKTPVDHADIARWVQRTLPLQPRRTERVAIAIPAAIVPRTDSLSAINDIGAQCRSERGAHTYRHSGAGAPKTVADLKKALQQQRNLQSKHPYPLYRRLHYATFDEFFEGQTWTHTAKTQTWVGTHFVYTLVIPVMKPAKPPAATNELIFNFYPSTGDPTMNFLEDNKAYTLFGQV